MTTSPTASQSRVSTSSATQSMPNMDVRHMFAATSLMLRVCQCCDVIRVGGYHIANIYKPPTEHWNNTNLPPVLPHPAVLVGDFNSHHPDWGYQEADLNGESLQEWALNNDYLLLHDAKQRGTFHSARWQRDYSPDLCWISTTVGHSQPASSVSTNLQLFTLASSFLSSEESNAEDGTSGQLTGLAIFSPQNVPFR